MTAIKTHHTTTSDRGWDGPANEARLRQAQPASYYRRAYAWQDPDGDETTKSAYLFIHHEVDTDGNVGAANVKACQTGIGVLNGGRGGTTIPDGDRQGVYQHLAAHLQDANLEPAELKTDGRSMERRAITAELRAETDAEGGLRLAGYAAVFNSLSEDLGGFREMIEPGFFDLAVYDDVRALWNHDPAYVLGRTRAGTLTVREDERGLVMECTPPDTQWARDAVVSVRRGDVDQMSFGFFVRPGGDEFHNTADGWVRILKRGGCERLYEVSPVTFPAYTATTLDVRERFAGLLAQAAALPHDEQPQSGRARARLDLARRRLELAEKEIGS